MRYAFLHENEHGKFEVDEWIEGTPPQHIYLCRQPASNLPYHGRGIPYYWCSRQGQSGFIAIGEEVAAV